MKKLTAGIVVILLAVVGLVIYWNVSKKETVPTEIDTEVSELSKVLAKDLEKEYPPTPREVVKLYSRITQCFYADELTDEELEGLVDMSLKMFDEELLAANPKDEYIKNLKATIEEYAAAKRVVTAYDIQSAQSIERYYLDDKEYSKVGVLYNIRDVEEQEKEDTGFLSGCGKATEEVYRYYSTYEDFLLRKDEDGNWKILVWCLPEIDIDDIED